MPLAVTQEDCLVSLEYHSLPSAAKFLQFKKLNELSQLSKFKQSSFFREHRLVWNCGETRLGTGRREI